MWCMCVRACVCEVCMHVCARVIVCVCMSVYVYVCVGGEGGRECA